MRCDDTSDETSEFVLTDLFRSHLAVHECQVGDFIDSLGDCESLSAQRMRASRQHEFSTGRHCARQAAHALQLTPAQREQIADIPVGDHRDPRWPDGVRGSISHDGKQAIAIVSNDPRCHSVGVDLLGLDAMGRMPSVNRLIATRDEISDAVGVLDCSQFVTAILADKNTGPDTSEEPGQVESTLAACVIFSVKESVFKCLYPALHEWIGLRDAHVSLRFDPNTLPGSLNGALNPLTPDAKPASTLSLSLIHI